MAELRGGGGGRRAERGREGASLTQTDPGWERRRRMGGPRLSAPWHGGRGSPSVIARDEDTDWPWQEVSGGREASLVPGQTSRHISRCVKDS